MLSQRFIYTEQKFDFHLEILFYYELFPCIMHILLLLSLQPSVLLT